MESVGQILTGGLVLPGKEDAETAVVIDLEQNQLRRSSRSDDVPLTFLAEKKKKSRCPKSAL